ncbi:MAG: DNA recombination protein RmuC [Patescibacteria group bacterium]|nr:DNA recombination protein RmuC [Patescibacteria group bacterium]MDD5716130.1 DNA recombination protein RmuC [Patescibacteria group bacterium]
MDIALLIIGSLVLISIIVTLVTIRRGGSGAGGNPEAYEKIVRLEERINQLNEKSTEQTRVLDSKLTETTRVIQEQFGHSTRIVRDVTEKLTKLDETNKQVLNFSDQLKNLQDILKNPKQRGVLGEYYLEETLKNVLPPNSYKMQYKFKDGEIVDAVVFVKDKIIPVDSKFSLENYERILNERDEKEKQALEVQFKADLKNRIDETSKYVRPSEDTMDFAFMFIPSEAIYYDLLVNKVGAVKVNTRDLIEYAFKEKHVIIVSPTSFLAYLQTVLQGLRALQIEESAKEIRKNVEQLGKHLLSYETYMQKVGQHLGTTVSSYNSAYKEFKKVDKDVLKIAEVGGAVEPLEIEKPKEE